MRTRRTTVLCFVTFAMVILATRSVLGQDKRAFKDVPKLLDLTNTKIEIVDTMFVKEMQGENARFEESEPSKFRGLLITIKVTKPAGQSLTIHAQDFVLHYKYGSSADVAKCYGLSTFSVQQSADRSMALYKQGIGARSTGPATAKADTLYADLFFQYMEPNTSELHLLVAQPIGANFLTKGWQ
jgi:hypothetical protein